MKIIKVLVLLIGLGTFAQSPLDRNQAIKLTLENNLNIKLIENSRDMAKNNASILNSGYLPTASLNSSSNISYQDIEIVAGEQNGSVEDSKNEAKKIIEESNKVLTLDIEKKKQKFNNEIEKEIIAVEKEIKALQKSSISSINKIATEISEEVIKQIIDSEVNKSNVAAIVEDVAKKEMEKHT